MFLKNMYNVYTKTRDTRNVYSIKEILIPRIILKLPNNMKIEKSKNSWQYENI